MKIYHSNIEKHATAIFDLDKITKRLSLFRLATFLFSLIVISVLANERLLALLWVVAPLCALSFALLIVRYNKETNRKKRSILLKEINESELLKFENELSSFPTGQSHLKSDHSYIADLDVFGSHSLFQLLNRTTTESGSICLARWLSEPAPKEVILERQQAIRELKPNLNWRQQLQIAGLPFINSESEYHKLLKWFEKSEQLLPKQTKYLIGSIILSVLSTVFTALYITDYNPEAWSIFLLPLLLVLLINNMVLRKVAPLAEEIIDHTYNNVKTLNGYQMLAQTIASEKFQSGKLKELQANLIQNEADAANEIRRLRKILEAFQLRGTKRSGNNMFYVVFNNFWLFDIYWIILTERWKRRNRNHVQPWIRAISEFEVINSLAGFAYSNPDFVFPEIKEEPYFVQFEMIGHPLIKSESRICNHFNLQERGQIAMITGSNMAGKSTFLRTVGVNLILALMGAPCCAKSGQVSSMNMFTSMRTQDNLEEGISSFYAELKRVEQLFLLMKSGQPIFFMLDEMFKGTNSEDRYKGGISLVKQLSELNAFGIISTHDLELARLAGNHMIVSNQSFNSKIHDEELSFNYKLQDGLCIDFNASELMKKSGIKILANIEKMR